MIATISQLKDYLRCPQLAYYAHHLRRVPVETPTSLEIGSIFHEAIAQRLKDPAHPRTNYDRLETWKKSSERAKDQFCKYRLFLPIDKYVLDPAWEIIQVEEALTSPDGALQGRPDVIIKYNDKYWSLQWKTYTDDLLDLIERVRLSWHEVAYQYLAESNGMTPWGGTILGACQKLPQYRIAPDRRTKHYISDEDRIKVFTTDYLARSPKVQKEMLDNLLLSLDSMDRDWELQLRNYDQCWGPFGGSRCPYFSVCHQGGSIDHEDFKTAEPRY